MPRKTSSGQTQKRDIFNLQEPTDTASISERGFLITGSKSLKKTFEYSVKSSGPLKKEMCIVLLGARGSTCRRQGRRKGRWAGGGWRRLYVHRGRGGGSLCRYSKRLHRERVMLEGRMECIRACKRDILMPNKHTNLC